MKNPIIKKEFESWLKKKKPNSKVGYAASSDSCPLANYLQDLGFEGVSVGMTDAFEPSYTMHLTKGKTKSQELDEIFTINLNKWQKSFISYVDKFRTSFCGKDKVTAKECLEGLGKI